MTTRAGKAEYGMGKCLGPKGASSDRELSGIPRGGSKVRFDTESREDVRVEVAPQSLRYVPAPDSLKDGEG